MLKYWQKPFYSFCFELQKQAIVVQNIGSVPSVQLWLEQPAESISIASPKPFNSYQKIREKS